MIMEKASLSDVPKVAKLHVRVFPGFFLTSLGTPFIEELYRGFLTHPSGIFIVARQDMRIIGFAAGTSNPPVFFSDLRRRRGFSFIIKAIPAVLKNPMPVCRKLLHAARFKGNTPTPVTNPYGALLSSIGLANNYHGSGVAKQLIAAFENEALAHGANFIYLTTDVHGNERANQFYVANGYKAALRFLQNGRREMIRYEKKLSHDL